jgi:hypothetical protein
MTMRKIAKRRRRKPSDRQLRMRVFAIMGNPDIEPRILCGNMDLVVAWLKTGKLPGARPELKVVAPCG